MKSKLKPNFLKLIKCFFLLTLFTIGFVGCKKERNVIAPASLGQTKFAQLSAVMSVLKANSTTQVFNDIDSNSLQVSNLNGKAFLLKFKSKTDNSKLLLYSKTNGVIHIRWAKITSNTASAPGTLSVGSLNQTSSLLASFKDGKILESRVSVNRELLANLNVSNKAALATNATKGSSVGIKANGSRSLDLDDGSDDGSFGVGSIDTGDGGLDSNDPSQEINSFTSGGSGGSAGTDPLLPDFTFTGVNALPEVTITATADDGSTVNMYSLYYLFGNNPDYADQYSTDPNGSDGLMVALTPKGTASGTDPNFVKGKSPATPVIKGLQDRVGGGLFASIGYALTVSGGNSTVTVQSITAGVYGNTDSFITSNVGSTAVSVNGSIISFSIEIAVNHQLGRR